MNQDKILFSTGKAMKKKHWSDGLALSPEEHEKIYGHRNQGASHLIASCPQCQKIADAMRHIVDADAARLGHEYVIHSVFTGHNLDAEIIWTNGIPNLGPCRTCEILIKSP